MSDVGPEKFKSSAVSHVLPDSRIAELVIDSDSNETRFAVYHNGEIEFTGELVLDSGEILIPVKGSNNLVKHKAILLPEKPEESERTAHSKTDGRLIENNVQP